MARQERPMGTSPGTMMPGGDGQEVRTSTTVTQERTTGPVTWEELRPLLRREPVIAPRRTWWAATAGTLAMIAGIWNIIVGAGIIFGIFLLDIVSPSFLFNSGTYNVTGTAAGAMLCFLGLVSVIGGYLAIKRRSWGMALLGSIAALVPSPVIVPFFMGVLSTVFITLGRSEFKDRDNRSMY